MRQFLIEVKRQWKADEVVRVGMKLRTLKIDRLLYGGDDFDNEIERLERRRDSLLAYLKETA